LNEVLCRALIRARLTDEDVAARLEVDPKTVRRWLQGRVPHFRHRWAIAMLVDMDEADLWPQLRSASSRPAEVVAVYSRRDLVPPQMWLRLINSARHEAGILADSDFLLSDDAAALAALAEQAQSGVRVRICLADMGSDAPEPETRDAGRSLAHCILAAAGIAEFRVAQVREYNSICYADEQFLVGQHVFGRSAGQSPMLHLRGGAGAELTAAYLAGFENIWSCALTADRKDG
jgi:phosphatidylserine/phosphatidylglycerophosphate/cardiolipin synthase-like enzyme